MISHINLDTIDSDIRIATTNKYMYGQSRNMTITQIGTRRDKIANNIDDLEGLVTGLIIVPNRSLGGVPLFFEHVCRDSVLPQSVIVTVYVNGKRYTNFSVEFLTGNIWKSTIDDNNNPVMMRILLPDIMDNSPDIEIQYTNSSSRMIREIASPSPVLKQGRDWEFEDDQRRITLNDQIRALGRKYIKEFARSEPIISGIGTGYHWPIYASYGNYNTHKLDITYDDGECFGILPIRKSTTAPTKIIDNKIYLPLTPLVADDPNRLDSFNKYSECSVNHQLYKLEISGIDMSRYKVVGINELSGIVYLSNPITDANNIKVTYYHGVREKVLNYPQFNASDYTNKSIYIFGIDQDGDILYKDKSTNPTTIKDSNNNSAYVDSETDITDIAMVSISPITESVSFVNNKTVGGGLSEGATREEQDFYVDIGLEDGPPIPGSKLIDIYMPANVIRKIANNMATLSRSTDADDFEDYLSKASELIKDRLQGILPAGAYYRVLYTEE